MKPKLNLKTIKHYKESSLEHLQWQLTQFFDDYASVKVEDIHEVLEDINAYDNIDFLDPIKEHHIVILDDEDIDISEAENVVLNGQFFWEHAAAGEATRLALGTKYLLNLKQFSIERVKEMIMSEIENDFGNDPEKMQEKMAEVTDEALLKQMGGNPTTMFDLSLGTRHLLQMAFDIKGLAEKHGFRPEEIMQKQKMLIVMNEKTAEQIVKEFLRYGFFGFKRENVMFMMQESFHGIDLAAGEVGYDESHDGHKRLHNHGQMAMQKTHDDSIFYINQDTSRHYLKSNEFEAVLSEMKDMISYNIEDIEYLTSAIDWPSMAMALDLGKKGHGMVMEIVAQNPLKPQKGGGAFFDKKLGRVVMIESNRLKGLANEDITHLNKNFNHYPNPVVAFRKLLEEGLHMHLDVKRMKDATGNDKHYLYFCPPQGDINFLVDTAYVMRKNLKPIANWKSPATTPPTVKACFDQDAQPGFKAFAEKILGVKL